MEHSLVLLLPKNQTASGCGGCCASLCPSDPPEFGISKRKLAQGKQEKKLDLQPGKYVTETEIPFLGGVPQIIPEICFWIQGIFSICLSIINPDGRYLPLYLGQGIQRGKWLQFQTICAGLSHPSYQLTSEPKGCIEPRVNPQKALASTAFDNGHHMWPRANYLLLDCLFHPCNIHKVNKSYQS